MTGPMIAGIALAWGFAEATLFFVVVDVMITFVTIHFGLRRGLLAVLWATVGAVVGGGAMYRWGAADPAGVVMALDRVPAIGAAMIEEVRLSLGGDWRSALFRGAFTGVPYKVYASLAPQAGIGMAGFLLVSGSARLARFLSLAVVTAVFSGVISTRLGKRQQFGLLTVIWIVFYALYWASTPG